MSHQVMLFLHDRGGHAMNQNLDTQGTHFSSASLQQLFKKMYTSVGIDGSSHSGRRSFCTNLSECGVSITNLQTLMGHQSISTTALYINENPKILGKITAGYSL